MQNITGPVGGRHTDYSATLQTSDCNRVVDNKVDLLSAIDNLRTCRTSTATACIDYICVADNAAIDLTSEAPIVLPAGLTLAGGRGMADGQGGYKPGALLFKTSAMGESVRVPLFQVEQPGVRITGLQIRGPDAYYEPAYVKVCAPPDQCKYYLKNDPEHIYIDGSRGIVAQSDLEIDNCELYAWNYSAIYVDAATQGQAYIHHNNIHDNKGPLGYGIEVGKAAPFIEYNIINDCKHAVSASPVVGAGYEAANNLVTSGVTLYYDYLPDYAAYGSTFDLHGSLGSAWNWGPAGSWIMIYHNRVSWSRGYAVDVRGRPRIVAQIFANQFSHAHINAAVNQNAPYGNMYVRDNETDCVADTCSDQAKWSPF